MTIDELKNYRSICAEIADIKKELAGHYAGDTVQSGSKHPYSVHNVRIEGYKSDSSTISLLTRLSVLERSRKEVDIFVKHIPYFKIRKAIKLYYIVPIEQGESKPTWESVADIMGNGCTSSSIKKSVGRYIKCHECHTCHKSIC